ncbi:hypothetical protein NCS57_01484500 [Fusarium keratoplasticum]|uniref:Uncharacterized protein n=1 Tax=Fusarium keratoplasticum TaxID=1328300 RepID=A0ACC0QBN3_9HYPO|nr:hypothetical protein NCS57_01484500 [Fusarium keratoplasticum]KAI8648167.1 hypothetical protein NCS57_01484500 [Fusarium keratoplasticum]
MTSNLVYGRQLTEAHFETYQRRQSFRLLSEEWHFLLGFPSAPGFSRATIPSGSKRGLAAVDLEHFQELQVARWKQLRKVNLDLELQRLLGSNATFRQGQKPILEAIMTEEREFLGLVYTKAKDATIFRAPTTRPNISYRVVDFPLLPKEGYLQSAENALRQLLDSKLTLYPRQPKL